MTCVFYALASKFIARQRCLGDSDIDVTGCTCFHESSAVGATIDAFVKLDYGWMTWRQMLASERGDSKWEPIQTCHCLQATSSRHRLGSRVCWPFGCQCRHSAVTTTLPFHLNWGILSMLSKSLHTAPQASQEGELAHIDHMNGGHRRQSWNVKH